MKTLSTTISPSLSLEKADRVGVAASILCAIHCGLAPILILALPSFGRVWAHPASHILVAIFVVPLAIFSIRKGYRTHQKRWILFAASIGILFVLVGAILPAFGKSDQVDGAISTVEADGGSQVEDPSINLTACRESACAGEGEDPVACESQSNTTPSAACVDNCCPSLQVDESGKTSLHIPPAAIVTTLGGIFLITAHIGNLCFCGHACRTNKCASCA